MVPYYGDYPEDHAEIRIPFNTFDSNDPSASVTVTDLADADIEVHADGDVTPIATDGASIVINFAGETGSHMILIDSSVDAAYTTATEYSVKIVGVTIDAATVNAWVGTFSIERAGGTIALLKALTPGGPSKSDMDAAHALLATSAQVDNIGAASGGSVNIQASEDNTGGAIIDSVTFVGSVQGATTFANTEAADGIYHDIDDTGDDIDIVYGFDVGGSRVGTEIVFEGFLQGNSDEIKVKLFDHVGSDWEIVGTLAGINGITNTSLLIPILSKHTGTSTELGKVYVRFETDSTTPSNLSVDQLLVSAVNIGQSVGYANGAVWGAIGSGTAGTESFTHGVADNKSNTFADMITIADAVGLDKFEFTPASSVTLGATINQRTMGMESNGWTLALGGRDINNMHIHNATVSGTGTAATTVGFHSCEIGTASFQKARFTDCGFTGTASFTAAGDYDIVDCHSDIAGSGAPTFAFSAVAITAAFRRWSGGLTFSGLTSDDTLTISGELGTINLGSPGSAVAVEVRGTYKEITNIGSAAVNLEGAILGGDVSDILLDTVEIGTAGAGLTNIDLPDQTMDITGSLSGSVGSVSGAVGSVTGAVGSVTGAVGSVTGAVGSVTGAVGSVAGNVDGNVSGSVASVAAAGITAASFGAGAIDAAALATDAVTEIANGYLDLASAVDGLTPRQVQAVVMASVAGELAGAATTTVTVKNHDGTDTRIVATVDANGNRSVVNYTLTGI